MTEQRADVEEITRGYTFDSAAIEFGVLVIDDQPREIVLFGVGRGRR
jgi:hypothetical protein